MASIDKQRIKNVFDDTLKAVRIGKKPNISGLMRQHGYSETSAKALKVIRTKAWEEFLMEIDEQPIAKKWRKWAISNKIDKRVALQAGENIMKLKGRFKEQLDIGLKQKREELIEP